MNEVLIRNVESTDFPHIKRIIKESWDINNLVESQETLYATLGMYLNQVLYKSTFGKVAVSNGEVVGLIFGSLNKEEPTYRMLIEDSAEQIITLMNASETDRKNISEFFVKTFQTYEELIENRIQDYEGCLEFFVVSEKARGLKIGKKLWHELKSYFESHNAQAIYVYTDTSCNYGFYDYNGFMLQSQQDVTFELINEQFPLTIFLYEYPFND